MSHGFHIRGADSIVASDANVAINKNNKSSCNIDGSSKNLGIGLVRPKIPDIGTRLTRRFSREERTKKKERGDAERKAVRFKIDSGASESEPELPPEVTKEYIREKIKRYKIGSLRYISVLPFEL